MNIWAKIGHKMLPQLTWKRNTNENIKTVYLTFDDGPHPKITNYVLDTLDQYQAKATFFVVGSNAIKFPNIIADIKNRRHKIGNHTMNHIKGWSVSKKTYLTDIDECEKYCPTDGLFRPPYGRINTAAIKEIRKNYEIIMWDVLTKDYNPNIKIEKTIERIKKQITDGSIVVFHDSEKAYPQLALILPSILEFLHQKNFQFCSL
jgi:peptidoglycan/xylan/chitin deacetylase (PgdA/CDA1 family)